MSYEAFGQQALEQQAIECKLGPSVRLFICPILVKMGHYDEEVKELLGRKAWNALIREVKKGRISRVIMDYFAHPLSPAIGQNHGKRGGCDEVELRFILSDWWSESLFDMNRIVALDKLIDIFSRDYVNLKTLASELDELREIAKRKSRSRSRSQSRSKPKNVKKQTVRDILKDELSKSPGETV